ncbi:MAG: CCA tRNA nucleotidyltransferase, partial [Aerococcus viridans]
FKAVFEQPKVQVVQDLFDQLPIQSLRDLAINGQNIIQEINPENKRAIGQMLQFLEQAVVAQDVVNDRAALLAYLDTHHDQINEI